MCWEQVGLRIRVNLDVYLCSLLFIHLFTHLFIHLFIQEEEEIILLSPVCLTSLIYLDMTGANVASLCHGRLATGDRHRLVWAGTYTDYRGPEPLFCFLAVTRTLPSCSSFFSRHDFLVLIYSFLSP